MIWQVWLAARPQHILAACVLTRGLASSSFAWLSLACDYYMACTLCGGESPLICQWFAPSPLGTDLFHGLLSARAMEPWLDGAVSVGC